MYYVIGYGFCEWCVRWIPLEGGDRLGMARELKEQPITAVVKKKKARKRSARF
jgi:hypothetical protein